MEKYLAVLNACPLFAEIDPARLETLLGCLSAQERRYRKNSFIFTAGQAVSSIGIVLSGSVNITREDYWGNRAILARIEPGGLFGEAFSCAGEPRLHVSVSAAAASAVLLIDYRRIITTCSSACAFHTRLIKNMLGILAKKNVMLTQKIEFITQRTIREKVLSYLSAQALKSGKGSFDIPFDRQELAEYLSVDRSALSNELSKMRSDGIITYHKNHFELI